MKERMKILTSGLLQMINFLQEIDGLSFREALAVLAEEAGVELPSYQKESQEERDVREQAREAMSRAKSLYKEALKGPAGADARAYLRGRGVTEEAAAKFELGWSPGEPGWLSKQLLQQGIPLDKFYSLFRSNQILFVIF